MFGLRGKILLITVLTPMILGVAAFITVHRNVQRHVDSTSIHENLEHSASVFESMLAVRLRALGGGARVIAQDPRFFSLVMLGPSQRDARFQATVRGMAHEFNRITETGLFEVFDRRGRVLASVGEHRSERAGRDSLLDLALDGHEVSGLLVQGNEHYQVALVPIRADGRIVGALMLGASVGEALARELRTQMRSEVTFLSGERITGSTLSEPGDRSALVETLRGLDLTPVGISNLRVIKVRGGAGTLLTRIGRIPRSQASPPQLYVMQRNDDPEITFLRGMQRDLGLLALLAVLTAILTGFALSEQILRPIRTLVNGAREMERGNFDAPMETRSSDEIGFLAGRFRAMRERERAYVASLEEAARLKSEFISVASHELRTPISVIQGYRDLLAEGGLGPMDERQLRALDAIRDCLTKLTKVADDATHVAQFESERIVLEPSICDARSLVDRAISQAMSSAPGRRVETVGTIEPGIGELWLDEGRMLQALTHLVANAVRFTTDGGRVEVALRREESQLLLEVRDSGIGIPAEQLRHVFERSLLLRNSLRHHSSGTLEFGSSGLGLGLAIVRGIVEAHGGTIGAESTEGRGTCFTVRLPLSQTDAARRAA